jgi:hypothetical protein
MIFWPHPYAPPTGGSVGSGRPGVPSSIRRLADSGQPPPAGVAPFPPLAGPARWAAGDGQRRRCQEVAKPDRAC